MKLKLGVSKVSIHEETEVPDDAFDYAFIGNGSEEATIFYLVPTDPDSALKTKVTEILHHLQGDYK